MKKHLCVLAIFAIAFVQLIFLCPGDFVKASAETGNVKNYIAYENDFESGQTFSNHEIVSDSDASRGKVAYFSNTSSKNRDFSMPNNNKIRVYLDVKLSSQSTFGVIIRGTDETGTARTSNYLIQITNGLIAGTETTIASGEWHSIGIELDYVAKKYSCTVCDSAGVVVADLAGQKFDFKKIVPGNQTAVRLSEKGDIYLDNIRLEEDIIWPQLDKITGSDGSVEIGYDEKTVVLKMTQPMAAVSKEHITVKSSVDGSIFPVSSVTVAGNDITIALDRKLQSSATYTLALSGDAAMSYKSLPIEDDVIACFTTAKLGLDVTDVIFSEDDGLISCAATVANETSSDKDVLLLLTSYDSDGTISTFGHELIKVNAASSNSSSNLATTVPYGGFVKLIAVNGYTNPIPVTNNIYTRTYDMLQDDVFMNSDFDTDESMAGIQIGSSNQQIKRVDGASGSDGYLFVEASDDTARIDVLLTTSKYMVFETDLCLQSMGFSGHLFMLGASSEYSYLLSLTSAGQIQTYADKKTLCTLQTGKWTTVSVVCDLENMTFDAYIDKKQVANDVPIKHTVTGPYSRLRVLAVNPGKGSLWLNNLKAYQGTEIRDISGITREPVNIMPDGSEATTLLKSDTAVDLRTGAIYDGSQKVISEEYVYINNDGIFISPDGASKLFSCDIRYESGNVLIGGQSIITNPAPLIRNGTCYLPLVYLAESVFAKSILIDDRDFVILSDTDIAYTDAELWKIHNYLLYERPTDDNLRSMFDEKSVGMHPRLIINSQDIDNIKHNYQSKAYYKDWYDEIIAEADSILEYTCYAYEPEALDADTYVRRTIRDRVITLALAYFMTDDARYPEKAFLELKAASELPHWHHEEHALNTAETMMAFAIGYDWFFDCWTDTQKELIEDAVYQKGMKFANACYYGMGTGTSTWWPTNDTNWGAAANGCVASVSIAFAEVYPELCFDLLQNALRGTEYALQSFYPSGAWSEGTGYFTYTTQHLGMLINTLKNTFGTDFNLAKAPSLELAGDYIIALNGPVASNNFHDNSEHRTLPSSVLFLAEQFNKSEYVTERLNAIQGTGLTPDLFDMLWWPVDFENESIELSKDLYFKGNELVVMRSDYADPNATYLSFHGGQVESQHSHVDAGAFVLDMNGERWASDLGADNYDYDGYFETGKKRYTYYRVRAEGHNVPVIDPDLSAGQNLKAFAPVECLESTEDTAYSVLDLTEAYSSYCTSLKRSYMLSENRSVVTICDEYEFKEGEHELYWFMHTKAGIEIVNDKTAILSLNGKRLKAELITNINGAKFTVMDATPLSTSPIPAVQNSNSKFKKLTVNAETGGEVYIRVRFSNAETDSR